MLAGTLRYRPVVLGLWAIVALLIVPFYMFSQRELAPAEDQGVIFAVLQTSANATLDQTKMFAHQVAEVYQSGPRNGERLSDHVSDRRIRRARHQAMERAYQDH
jgi:multidrug efflux pump